MIKEDRDKKNELREKVDSKKELGVLLKSEIEHLQEEVDKENIYKKYIQDNWERVTNELGVNKIVENHDDAVFLIKNVDIRNILGIDEKLNVPFQSKIFGIFEEISGICNTEQQAEDILKSIEKESRSVIAFKKSVNKLKKWTYYIKYIKENRMVYINKVNSGYKLFFKRNQGVDRGIEEESFDIIDLFQIIFNIEPYQAIVKLCDLLQIKIKYNVEQEKKYDYNIELISNDGYLNTKYPELYRYTKKFLYILAELNEEGRKNINSSRNCYSGENIFFCSGKYLEDKLKEKLEQGINIKTKTQNEISKVINMFCVLGLVIKIKNDDVPVNFRKPTKGRKRANYYIISMYNENILLEAQDRVSKLKGISAMNITGDECKRLLGEQIYQSVYANNENSTKKAQNTKHYKKQMKDIEYVS